METKIKKKTVNCNDNFTDREKLFLEKVGWKEQDV